MSEDVMQLPVSCMMGNGPVSAKSTISSTHFDAEARHMSIRSGSWGESSRRWRWRMWMKSSMDQMMTCSLSCSKFGGGAERPSDLV